MRERTVIATQRTDPLVFLAEDSDDDAFFFERALRKANVGCSLVRAANGKIAIEMLQVDRLERERGTGCSVNWPVLIFLDLKMPVMSGFEVLERLRFSGLEHLAKVIVLSGSNDNDDRARAMRLGAMDYLVKPITAEILRERIFGQLDLRGEGQPEAGVETRASV